MWESFPSFSSVLTSSNDPHPSLPPTASSAEVISWLGWQPDPTLSDDENIMDLVLMVTQLSHLKQGSMACVLVSADPPDQQHQLVQPDLIYHGSADADATLPHHDSANKMVAVSSSSSKTTTAMPSSSPSTLSFSSSSNLMKRIMAIATNQPLYSAQGSDVHAEITALGQVAQKTGITTRGATAYITMPPCATCLGALIMAGLHRVVSRYPSPQARLRQAAQRRGLVWDTCPSDPTQLARVQHHMALFHRRQRQQQQQRRQQRDRDEARCHDADDKHASKDDEVLDPFGEALSWLTQEDHSSRQS